MQKTPRWAAAIVSVGLLSCANRSGSGAPNSAQSASNDQAAGNMNASSSGRSSENSGSAMANDQAAANDTGMTGNAPGSAMSMGAASGTLSNMPLTDGQILEVAETVDKGEVQQAQAMQSKAQSSAVQQLAQHLIQDHQKNEQKIENVEQSAQVSPEESALSHDLQQTAQQTVQQIQQQPASEAERTFVNAQVSQHQKVLQLLNDRLIPSAINSDLKQRLEETRKMIEQHLERAKQVQEALSNQAGSSATSS